MQGVMLAFGIVVLIGCTHRVHSLNISENLRSEIDSHLALEANQSQYQLRNCWSETDRLTICRVDFFGLEKTDGLDALQRASGALKQKEHEVGFCGILHPSPPVVALLTTAMVVQFAAALVGGSTSYVHYPAERLKLTGSVNFGLKSDPCFTIPVE